MNFSGKFGSAETIWYPAAGCLSRDDGDVYNVGSYGYWWSCTPYGNYAYCLRRDLYSVGVVRPSAYFNRAYGLSVRCASDVSSPSLEPTLGSADDAEPASYPASERDSGHSMNTSGVKSIQGIPYTYEFWMDGGRGQMTYYNDGTFMSMFNTVSDCLARVGYRYNFPNGPGVDHKTKNYVVDFKAVKSGNASYGYIGAYGWTANPQMEFYIVDDWFGTSALVYQGTKKGEITVNGATYDIYTVQRTNAPSVTGPSNFVQVWSVRRTARQKGRIHISEHFSKWEELGIGSINPVEVSFLCEVGGNATGSFECTYLDFKEYFPY